MLLVWVFAPERGDRLGRPAPRAAYYGDFGGRVHPHGLGGFTLTGKEAAHRVARCGRDISCAPPPNAIEENAERSFTDEPGCRSFDVVCDLADVRQAHAR
ncbi:putative protein OS=Streptomyces aurantiogriseus OX=66870 GN=GCM10010251_46790 PE=4 SV=1 [Streptomyces aurantiogriseus]|uniref:Uncharacterized protein n=1 Tax=Streptomyces aurantiogriseus TaxID=66870 RepID=A0A918FDT2_9ACTN|nr:hypothetical protein GCM10010251_46790 [Streptomyces aurantiogriseus]